MRVGMVGKYLPEEDGTAIYTDNLCRELDRAGIEVIKIGDNASTTAHYTSDLGSFRLSSRLRKIVEKEQLDLLHIQYVPSYFSQRTFGLNLLLALGQKVPVVVTFHEIQTSLEGLKGKLRGLIQKRLAAKSEAAIALSRRQKEYLQLKYRKKNAHTVHMGIEQVQMRKLMNKHALYLGMLNYGKGVEYLIKAMNDMPDYTLTVAGKAASREYEEHLRAEAKANKAGNVRLDLRWIHAEEKRKYLEEADIMAFPFIAESHQSAAVHDAFSYGIPVVVTDSGAVSEIVKEYICGRVVEQRSPKALAAGIRAVHGNYATYQHGIAKYREDASWAKTAQKHAEIYNETLQAHYDKHGVPEKEPEEEEPGFTDEEHHQQA